MDLAEQLIQIAATYDAAVIINDRADIAAMARAAGVHVGQDDLSPSEARRIVGDNGIVGYSTHSVDQIVAARREPATYVAVGPVFGTRTKDTGYNAVGLELVSKAVAASGSPLTRTR